MSVPPPPPLRDKGKREGGCTLVVRDLEPSIAGGRSATGYLSVTDSKDDAVKRVNDGRRCNRMIAFERNDFTVFSGQIVYVDPYMVVSVT